MMSDDQQKQLLVGMMEMMFGEEITKDILNSPNHPDSEIEQGEEELRVSLTETEKFFYSLLPNTKNSFILTVVAVPLARAMIDLWWGMVKRNHGLQGGNLGIRKGWKLVTFKEDDPLSRLLGGR